MLPVCLLLMLLLAPLGAAELPAATASPGELGPLWQIDSEQSGCDFSLRALHWFKVSGHFSRIEGTVSASPEGPQATIRVPITSVRMSSKGRRDWALSPEFFDAARFPELRFDAVLPGLDRESLRQPIKGSMLLRGIRGAVRFRVTEVDCDPLNTHCLILAKSSVSRRRFGMTSQRLLLGDRVKLKLRLFLHRVAPLPADGKP